MVPSETASKIHVLSTARKITGGGTALVSGETEKARVLMQLHLFQAGHPKASVCSGRIQSRFHHKRGEDPCCFC